MSFIKRILGLPTKEEEETILRLQELANDAKMESSALKAKSGVVGEAARDLRATINGEDLVFLCIKKCLTECKEDAD